MPDLLDLCRPGSRQELALVRAALDANGIEYLVINEFGGVGGPLAIGPDELIVRVRPEDLAAARAALPC